MIIAGTTRAVAKLHDKSWENVVAMLSQNPLLEPTEDEIHKIDTFTNADTSALEIYDRVDSVIVRDVETWLASFIAGVCMT